MIAFQCIKKFGFMNVLVLFWISRFNCSQEFIQNKKKTSHKLESGGCSKWGEDKQIDVLLQWI